MFDLEEWLRSWLGANDMLEVGERTVFVGQFVDDKIQGLTKTKFVINSTSGTVAPADVRYSIFRISAVSYKNKGLVNDKALKQVENDINLLLDHIQSTRIFPCGYGNIRAVTTIQGPTFTADNRVVYSLDIELLK